VCVNICSVGLDVYQLHLRAPRCGNGWLVRHVIEWRQSKIPGNCGNKLNFSQQHQSIPNSFFFCFIIDCVRPIYYRSWQYTHIRPCPRHYGSSLGHRRVVASSTPLSIPNSMGLQPVLGITSGLGISFWVVNTLYSADLGLVMVIFDFFFENS